MQVLLTAIFLCPQRIGRSWWTIHEGGMLTESPSKSIHRERTPWTTMSSIEERTGKGITRTGSKGGKRMGRSSNVIFHSSYVVMSSQISFSWPGTWFVLLSWTLVKFVFKAGGGQKRRRDSSSDEEYKPELENDCVISLSERVKRRKRSSCTQPQTTPSNKSTKKDVYNSDIGTFYF